MSKRLCLLFIVLLTSHISLSQTLLDWEDMIQGVSYTTPENGAELGEFLAPTYSEKMKNLIGKEVTIVGYFLVLEGEKESYMLSQNPMASCFFCGNGGPETIIELYFDKKPPFEMDDLLSIEGKLKLNTDDPDHTYYSIVQANGLTM